MASSNNDRQRVHDVLAVLSFVRDGLKPGRGQSNKSVKRLRNETAWAIAKQRNVTPTTVSDSYLRSIRSAEFDQAIEEWLEGQDPGRLQKLLEDKIALNQEELSTIQSFFGSSVSFVSGLVQDLNAIGQQENVDPTTKEALIDARLGQGKFRIDVLQSWGNCCSVTGSMIQAAIRASHIKPWRESSNAERLDPNNGLPLIASLDALFDSGLISFDSLGKLIVASKISTTEQRIFGIGESSLRKKPTAIMVEYLAHHGVKHGFNS